MREKEDRYNQYMYYLCLIQILLSNALPLLNTLVIEIIRAFFILFLCCIYSCEIVKVSIQRKTWQNSNRFSNIAIISRKGIGGWLLQQIWYIILSKWSCELVIYAMYFYGVVFKVWVPTVEKCNRKKYSVLEKKLEMDRMGRYTCVICKRVVIVIR